MLVRFRTATTRDGARSATVGGGGIAVLVDVPTDERDERDENKDEVKHRRGWLVQADRDERSKPPRPTIVATPPPISSQIVLSVGDPVKKREKWEPTESAALIP